MSTDIKPCPFCGAECVPNIIKTFWFVECLDFNCAYFSGGKLGKSEAIEAHNQLTDLREENERLRKRAIIWHKWPGKKPVKYFDEYLVKVNFAMSNNDNYLVASYCRDTNIWNGPYIEAKTVTHWAEIPKPEVDES